MPHPARLTALLGAALLSVSPLAADNRADFLKLIDRPRVPLASEAKVVPSEDGLIHETFSFAADATNRVPGILVKPAGPATRRPVIIYLHGTDGNKENQNAFLATLAQAGFVVVAIDARHHGERRAVPIVRTEYVDSVLGAFRGSGEHPFFFDPVWDTMRLVDYLETRADIDPKRIGLFGISKGGIETYLTAAVDPRIAVAVPFISVESFRWAAENNSWQARIGTVQAAFNAAAADSKIEKPDGDFVHTFYSKIAPGIDREFDGPAMVPLIAPRPLLAINGEIDPRTPKGGLDIVAAATRAAYEAAGAADKFVLHIQPNTPHQVKPESLVLAREWFVRWLKP